MSSNTRLARMTTPRCASSSVHTDPIVFERECEGMFRRGWIFAGLANELEHPNDFLRVPLTNLDVIVQNGNGTLRAFLNACSHRHSLIHVLPRGNRPLVCPYHGWTYDETGTPTGIPSEADFPEVCANRQAFRLHEIELDRAGHFLFVRAESGGPDLRSFLGEAHGFLELVSNALGEPFDEQRETVHANWKIVIENSLEGYHVPLVHRESLGAIAQLSRERDSVTDFIPSTGHSHMRNAADAKWMRRWSAMKAEIGDWPFAFDYYVHQLVFPILTVTSFLGYSFHIQRFHPDATNATTVHSRIYGSKFVNQSERGAIILRNIVRENIDFTHRIFGEDRAACERVQGGSSSATIDSVLGERLEKRVADFRRTYLRYRATFDRDESASGLARHSGAEV